MYICPNCRTEYDPDDLYEVVSLDEINNALRNIKDLSPIGASLLKIGCAFLKISVRCKNCYTSCIHPVNAIVEATPVYDYHHGDRMPSVIDLKNIKLKRVLPADAKGKACSSSMPVFKSNNCYDDSPPPLKKYKLTSDQLNLLMIVKTKMPNGYCYIGVEIERGDLVRPILRTGTDMCCWAPTDPQLKVGHEYQFKLLSRYIKEIPFPHRKNDVHVQYLKHFSPPNLNLFDILVGHSHRSIEEVFRGGNIIERKYINVDTSCPSVGIYKCSGECVSLNCSYEAGKTKTRCNVKEGEVTYSFSYTSLADPYDLFNNEDLLLILGLARPFKGSNGDFSPMRCYILVLGIIPQSTPTNQEASGQQPN